MCPIFCAVFFCCPWVEHGFVQFSNLFFLRNTIAQHFLLLFCSRNLMSTLFTLHKCSENLMKMLVLQSLLGVFSVISINPGLHVIHLFYIDKMSKHFLPTTNIDIFFQVCLYAVQWMLIKGISRNGLRSRVQSFSSWSVHNFGHP